MNGARLTSFPLGCAPLSIAQRLPLALLLLPLAAAGCASHNQITAVGDSIGQEVTRSRCPAVAIPAYTGTVTLFDPAQSRDASAIDVVATITDLRSTCDDSGTDALKTHATFRVDARRRDAHGARDVVLPYFAVVMRGGTQMIAKSISRVAVHFDDGKLTASTQGVADASVSRAEATLSPAIRDRLARKRSAGDADATVDPLNDPGVKAALARASFELLVGFQLTREQLAYNATL